MRISAYIAISLDGYIARKNGDLDWLNAADEGAEEDFGYQEFMDSVDVMILGRRTFEQVLTFAEWPYGVKPVVVLSRRHLEIPTYLMPIVSVSLESPGDLVARLISQGATHLYIDGGVTIQRFLAAGLIDEITLTYIPLLLGAGIPLFGPLNREVRLMLLATRAFTNGYVQSRYRIVNGGGGTPEFDARGPIQKSTGTGGDTHLDYC